MKDEKLKKALGNQIEWWTLIRQWVNNRQVDDGALLSAAVNAENAARTALGMELISHEEPPPKRTRRGQLGQ